MPVAERTVYRRLCLLCGFEADAPGERTPGLCARCGRRMTFAVADLDVQHVYPELHVRWVQPKHGRPKGSKNRPKVVLP